MSNYHKGQQLPREQLRNDFRTDCQGECTCVYTKIATLRKFIENTFCELSCWFLSLPKIGRFSPPFEWLFCPPLTPFLTNINYNNEKVILLRMFLYMLLNLANLNRNI